MMIVRKKYKQDEKCKNVYHYWGNGKMKIIMCWGGCDTSIEHNINW